MRIIAGEFRGRTIKAPEGLTARPTTDRVREALFSMILSRFGALEEARVLDLFAGSGALGLEALSRGAAYTLFVESDANARGAIRNNCEELGLTGRTRIFKRDAADLGPLPAGKGGPFDLVFLDPPYGQGLAWPALLKAAEEGWLAPQGLAAVETSANEPLAPLSLPGFTFETANDRVYGDTRITLIDWRKTD